MSLDMDSPKKRVLHYFISKKKYYSEFSHLKLSKRLLRIFGLWPYDKGIKKCRNYMIFAMSIIISLTALIKGLMEVASRDIIIFHATIVAIIWLLSSLMLETTLYISEKSLKTLYDQIRFNWIMIKDAEEIAIVKTSCAAIDAAAFFSLNFVPWFFEKPEEYEQAFAYYSKLLIIYDDHYKVQIIIHIFLILFYGSLLYSTILYVYLYSVYHTCGMFDIVSFRLRKLSKSSDMMLLNANTADKIIPELTDIIYKHNEAIRNTRIIEETFSLCFHILQIFVIICLAILIFGFQLSFNIKNVHLTFRVIPMAGIILQYGFYLNYGGEQIIEYSEKVFTTTCYTCWESMPLKAKKTMMMLMIRSSKSCVLKAGLMKLSLGNFKALVNVAWSCATVLFSTQKAL